MEIIMEIIIEIFVYIFSNIESILKCLFYLLSSILLYKTLRNPDWLRETKVSIKRIYLPKIFELQRFIQETIDCCYDNTIFDVDFFYNKISQLAAEINNFEYEWKSVGKEGQIQSVNEIYEIAQKVINAIMVESFGSKFQDPNTVKIFKNKEENDKIKKQLGDEIHKLLKNLR